MVILVLEFLATLSVILKSLVSGLAYKKDHPVSKVSYFDCFGILIVLFCFGYFDCFGI